MTSDLTSPTFTEWSSWLTSFCRNRSSSCRCQSVCSTALRPLPTELKDRPGSSVPRSDVFGSACSWTSLVLRLGNSSSPAFSRINAFFPSQTITQSPCRIFSFCMQFLSTPAANHAAAWPWRPCSRSIFFEGQTPGEAIPFGSVRRAQQPSRDHLRLDFRRALENAEDAGVAEDARDRKFKRETVAAVDLHGIVGIGPGDAGGEQLGHAGLEIAAFARVLLARGEIG